MLPSMPLLMTPIKELHDDSSDTSDDSPFPHNSIENEHGFVGSAADTEIQHVESAGLLILNSCTPESSKSIEQVYEDKVIDLKPHTPEKRSLPEPSSAQKKKKKNQHRKTMAALTPESGVCLENSAQNFAEAYFQKVRNQVDCDKWAQFVHELVEFEAKHDRQPAELYRKMESLLNPHSELVDEFLAFLLPHQALQVNRFMDYLLLISMKDFFRKLNILLMKRQSRQVYSALEALAAKPNVTLAHVKDTILPLLKSSPLLTNLFLELLPRERPPDSLMTDFEQMDFKDDSLFETIMVPDCPDPYGNENCICSCHATQKNRHCMSCGIKYLNGRVYLQYGKVLRPAKVTFKDNKHLDLRKWEEDKCQSRRRLMPKSMHSPSCLDHRLNADSEDDIGVKKSPRTPRIRVNRPKVCKKGVNENKEEEALEGIYPLVESKSVVIAESVMGEVVVDCEMKQDGIEEHEFDDVVIDNECNTEEDEEEDLNKCMHSENESSLEAEDIAKELGNDCSFEDEEMEDIENSELIENEELKTSLGDNHDELIATESSVQNKDKHEKITSDKLERSSEENTSPKLEPNNSEEEIKQEIEPTSDIPKELLCGDKSSPKPTVSNDIVDVSLDIMDVSYERCSSSVKTEINEEVEFKEEIVSFDNTDGGKSTSELENSSKEWTREEDKIILQTFQHENGLEQTFETASLQLPNRTKEEIQERFEVLLKLLKEMISDESNSNP